MPALNLILLHPEDRIDASAPLSADTPIRVVVRGRRLEHVRTIHRAAVGDVLCVGFLGGDIGQGRVMSLSDSALELEVTATRPPPPPLRLTLLLALPRPPVLRRVLIACASLGVERIFLVNARRVEKSYWQSKAMAPEEMRAQLVLGAEQARDTRLPEVSARLRFRPFVEDELPGLITGSRRILADPSAPSPCPRALEGPISLAVGPEGGWSDFELDRLVAAGFEAVHLGERILRVETVVPALIARLT